MDQSTSRSMVAVEGLKKPKAFLKKQDKDVVRSEQATDYYFMGCRILGMQLPERFKIPYIIYAVIVNGFVTIFLPIAFALTYKKVSEGAFDVSTFLTSVYVAIVAWSCGMKIIALIVMMKKLKACNAVTVKMDARCKEPDEIQELRNLRAKGRRYFIMFTVTYFSYEISTIVASLFMGQPPYSLYLPGINWQRSRGELIAAFIIEHLLVWIACFQEVINDSYGVIYLGVLRSHLKILKIRLRKLGSNTQLTSDATLEELKLCIKDHKNYIELFNTVAEVISVTLFIQFTITATCLGICLINMFIFISDIASIIAAAIYLLCVMCESVPLCYHADCLVEENLSLSDAIFYCHWVDQDPRFRKMLVVFIQQAQRPMQLMAGKILPINLDTIIRIIKFSFSLYTFISRMNIKERLNL